MNDTETGAPLQIVVLDRGFVYVGRVAQEGDELVIRGARNIRRWGTKSGLGQLALNGPQPSTILDEVGTVRTRSFIHLIDCVEDSWA